MKQLEPKKKVPKINRSLALKPYGAQDAEYAECLPRYLEENSIHWYLKRKKVYFDVGSVIPLRKSYTRNQTRTLADVEIMSFIQFIRRKKVWTKGKYRIKRVFREEEINQRKWE